MGGWRGHGLVSAAGIAAVAGAGLIAVGGLGALTGRHRVALVVQGTGVLVMAAAGIAVFVGGASVGAGFRSGVHPAFGLDGLSGFFLLVLGVVALPALAYARDALPAGARSSALAGLTAAFVLAMAGLVAARDITTFLACWELMTLVPAAAMLVARQDEEVRRAVIVYVGVTHVGAVGVWAAMLILSAHGAIGGPPLGPGGLQSFVIVAAFIGFLTKAGIAPFHIWLPRAHPVAPTHISALMSGVMIMLGLYGLIRVLFLWLTALPTWAGVVLVLLGSLSALVGVLYALVQRELKRLLAFSSIEHAGIVVLGLGAAILLGSAGQPQWAAIAFAGALLQVLNHAVFKGALFLGAGVVGEATGTLDIDRMGGLLKRMPVAGGAIGVAALAIAGLPLLNGFVSEWIGLQALLRLPIDETDGLALVGAFGAATLAATAALAALCFIGVAGLMLLGHPRSPESAAAREPAVGTRVGLAFLGVLCLVFAVLAGVLVPQLAQLGPGAWAGTPAPGLDLPGTGSLPTPILLVALAVLTGLVTLARGRRRAAPAPVWVSGQIDEAPLAWTLGGFTKPLRLMVDVVLRTRRDTVVTESAGIVERVSFRGDVPHVFDTNVFEPVLRVAARGAQVARRLQSGHLRSYLAYLVALLLVLLLALRLGVIS
jgi:hydrogenase-4 component B